MPLAEALKLGQVDGAYRTVFARQDKLLDEATAGLLALWRDLAAQLGIAGAIASFRREAHMLAAGEPAIPSLDGIPGAQDHRRRQVNMLAATAAAGITAGMLALPGWDKLTGAFAAAMTVAAGEGHAAALGVAAHKAGAQGYDWDQAAGDGQIEPAPMQAGQAAQSVLYGAARDITRALARAALAGAAADIMADAVTGVLDDGRSLIAYAGQAIMSAFGSAVLAVYSAAGVGLLNWCAVDDGRTCAACESNEDNSPYTPDAFPGLPQHPNCRCWSEPSGAPLSSAAYSAYIK